MIPNNLIDVFGALTVGLLSLYVLTMLLWSVDRNNLSYSGYVTGLAFRPRGKFWGMIFILASYGFGLLMEDITDHLTDVDTDYAWYEPQKLQQMLLGKESKHRFDALFKSDQETGELRLNHLGREVFRDTKYVAGIIGVAPASFVDGQTGTVLPNADIEDVCGRINAVYYDAKNWCYSQDNYFAELESIQQRVDFSRSCFLVSSWGLMAYVPILVLDYFCLKSFPVKYASGIRCLVGHRRLRPGTTPDPWASPCDASWRSRLVKCVSALLVVSLLGCTGYWHSENVFNERAFGYHVSHRDSIRRGHPQLNPQSANRQALLWMRASAEYVALCRQVFSHALRAITDSAEGQSQAKLAVVLDLDETVLDNTSFNAMLSETLQPFSSETWNQWLHYHSDLVRSVPGAREFIESVPSGVDIVFVSNRPEQRRSETIDTLRRLQLAGDTPNPSDNDYERYWNDHLLLQQETSGKQTRRAQVEEQFTVVALIGDNLADFDSKYEHGANSWEQRRSMAVDESKFGSNWFVLPNPLYGDWATQLTKTDADSLIFDASGLADSAK